jgi:hypothetical protein
MQTEKVPAEKWEQTGFSDGRNGNAPWVPYGTDKVTEDTYMRGYERGVAARPNTGMDSISD